MSEHVSLDDSLAEHIAALLRESFPGRVLPNGNSSSEIPAVTVAEVVARLQLDLHREGGFEESDMRSLSALSSLRDHALPLRLTPRVVSEFLIQNRIQASRRFQEKFAEAAIFLRMGRRQSAQSPAKQSGSIDPIAARDETAR
jgi:hypothetical protein